MDRRRKNKHFNEIDGRFVYLLTLYISKHMQTATSPKSDEDEGNTSIGGFVFNFISDQH